MYILLKILLILTLLRFTWIDQHANANFDPLNVLFDRHGITNQYRYEHMSNDDVRDFSASYN